MSVPGWDKSMNTQELFRVAFGKAGHFLALDPYPGPSRLR